MRILVTGATGQVGWELLRSLMPVGKVIAVDRARCDLSRPESIAPLIRELGPAVIVNAAAYTAVDKAETEEALATTINGTSVGVLAQEAKRAGALLVHYSTDYVFDGKKSAPYVEDDTPNPLNAYGRSKLAGEIAIRESGCAHLILRTSWVYGARGRNFAKTILRLAREQDTLNIVADQFGAPTSARFIADSTAHIVRRAFGDRSALRFSSGTYHLTAGGSTNWHRFAEAIVYMAGQQNLLDTARSLTIHPIAASAYSSPAPRPKNSRLDCNLVRRHFGVKHAEWHQALERVVEEMAFS